MDSIAVFGAGSWGTALAISLATAGREVTLWARGPEAVAVMAEERRNPTYLPEAYIPREVVVTGDLAEAAERSTLWVAAVPSQQMRALAEQLRPHVHDDVAVVSVAKGIENETLLRPTEVLEEVLGAATGPDAGGPAEVPPVPPERIGVLSGPSHAEEVAVGLPTTLVAAAAPETARRIQRAFMSPRLRVYINPDVVGVEIGGAVKNVLAIAAGMSDGVGYGDNAKAALITRGMAEIQRLGLALGADAATFAGLTGIGDLVVTCMSRHSRNRHVGEQVGRGRTLEEVEAEMQMVAEGVRTTVSVHGLAARLGIEMPITEAVYSILFEGKRPETAVFELMTRTAKREDWLPDVLQDS